MAAVPDFDPATPSIARVYDYLLHGKDNFAVDREVAEKLMAVAPLAALAPGSYVVLSVGRGDSDAAGQRLRRLLRRGDAGVQPLGSGVRQLLRPAGTGPAGLGRRPGVAPGLEHPVHLPPRDGQVIVGVARVG